MCLAAPSQVTGSCAMTLEASSPAPFHSLFMHTAVTPQFSHHGNVGSCLLVAPYPSIFSSKSCYDVHVRGITSTEWRGQSWNGQLIIFAQGFPDATHSGLLFSDIVTSNPQSNPLRWHHYFLSMLGEIVRLREQSTYSKRSMEVSNEHRGQHEELTLPNSGTIRASQ